jgi:hypothetical protein
LGNTAIGDLGVTVARRSEYGQAFCALGIVSSFIIDGNTKLITYR